MQDDFRIVEQKIIENGKILKLKIDGKIQNTIINNKLRIIIVFQCQSGKKQRRYPVEALCFPTHQGVYFRIDEEIWLEHVFLEMTVEEIENDVQLFFEYCDANGEWRVLPNKMSLAGIYFRKKERKKTFWYSLHCKVLFCILTILLPFLLVDGYFVGKGYKKSPYLTKEKMGKKAMFYHANGIVHSITGYGYSKREYKTNYFAKKYAKYCKKQKEVSGVLFLSERECEKGGNLDCIREGMKKRGAKWSEHIDTRLIHQLPKKEIRKVARLAAGAKVIVLEDFYPQIHALNLRKETELVQLWHACGAFKLFGLSELGKVDYLFQDTKNHRSYTAAICSGKKMIPFYSEAYGISPSKVYPLGVPRTDVFFDTEYQEETKRLLYRRYPLLRGKKVVLFAPTFRGSGNKNAYYPTARFVVDSFMSNMPDDTVLIIKNHPFVKDKFEVSPMYASRVLDLTGQENINDLLFLTDVLITDYSSSIFEAALLHIPTLFYVFDLDEYIRDRDFYFDFASFSPGERVYSFEDLTKVSVELLKQNKEDDEKQQIFRDYFLDSLDGHSTERVLDFIEQLQFVPPTGGDGMENV